jgi:hypothetical protein
MVFSFFPQGFFHVRYSRVDVQNSLPHELMDWRSWNAFETPANNGLAILYLSGL